MSSILAQARAIPVEEADDDQIGRPLWTRLRRQPPAAACFDDDLNVAAAMRREKT